MHDHSNIKFTGNGICESVKHIDESFHSLTLTTVGVKITVLWNVMPRSLVATTRINTVKFQ
jgi:hypothetical protein